MKITTVERNKKSKTLHHRPFSTTHGIMHPLIETVNVLNVEEDESTLGTDKIITDNIDKNSFIVSDADEELLILIEFPREVHLEWIKLHALPHDDSQDANDVSAPKNVSIYKLSDLNKQFEDFDDIEADKEVVCKQKKLKKGQIIKLDTAKTIKFNKTKYFAIYIKSNQNDTESTYLNGISFKINNTVNDFGYDDTNSKTMQELDKLTDEWSVSEVSNTNNNNDVSEVHNIDIPLNSIRNRSTMCVLSECSILKRIIPKLKSYHEFVNNQNNSTTDVEDISDVIYGNDDNYSSINLINDYIHLLMDHGNDFDDIYDTFREQCNDTKLCEMKSCVMMNRNMRDRHTENDTKDEAYFNNDNQNDILTQRLFDKLHSYFFHTIQTGYRLSRDERNTIIDNESKSNEEMKYNENDGYSDRIAMRISSILRTKRNNKYRLNSTKFSMNSETISSHYNDYSFGIRFFYWNSYQHNQLIKDPAHSDTANKQPGSHKYGDSFNNWLIGTHNIVPPANGDQPLSFWYISNKYQDLKTELLNNAICHISLLQWNLLYAQCLDYQQTILVKNMQCGKSSHAEQYGLDEQCLMHIEHLIAIKVQCDFDVCRYVCVGPGSIKCVPIL